MSFSAVNNSDFSFDCILLHMHSKIGERSYKKNEGQDSWDCQFSCFISCSSGNKFLHPPFFLGLDSLDYCFEQPILYLSLGQTCVKHCSQEEKNGVFMELRPHFISVATNTYAVHLVTKMLDNGNIKLDLFIQVLFARWFSVCRGWCISRICSFALYYRGLVYAICLTFKLWFEATFIFSFFLICFFFGCSIQRTALRVYILAPRACSTSASTHGGLTW